MYAIVRTDFATVFTTRVHSYSALLDILIFKHVIVITIHSVEIIITRKQCVDGYNKDLFAFPIIRWLVFEIVY
jgi:hypothetical protein